MSSSYACVLCVAAMLDPFRDFLNHTIVYSSVIGRKLKIRKKLKPIYFANLWKKSSRENFSQLWKVQASANLPFPSFLTMHVGKVGILKRHMDSFNWFH